MGLNNYYAITIKLFAEMSLKLSEFLPF